MTRSHSRREKSGRSYPVSQDDLLEGTAARTRPFSYDEIMLRRSNKRDAANQVPSCPEVADIALGHDKIDKISDFPTLHRKINEDSGPMDIRRTLNDSRKVSSWRKGDVNVPKKSEKLDLDKNEGSQYHDVNQVPSGPEVADIALGHDKIDNISDFPTHHRKINEDSGPMDVRRTLNDSRKVSSWRKGDVNVPKKSEKLDLDKNEGSQYHGVKLKSIWDKTEGNKRGREGENDRRDHSDRKKDAPLGAGLDYGLNKRQARDSSYRKDRTSEGVRVKSEIDRKPIFNDERQVHRKRKTERRTNSDSEKESTRRNERITNRGREKSEKEYRHKRHNEEDKTKIGGTYKKDDSERKVPEPIRVSLKESRAKRRISRSREREKDRARRSRSCSPKANKHTPKDKRQQGDTSSRSTKDRLGREHSEADKNMLSIIGSSIHNRRSTGLSSGLGGYSPRKRKTAAAAKTPSPTHRSPERRNAQWDLQPVEKESIMASSTLNNMQAPSQNLTMNTKEFAGVTPVVLTMAKPIVISHQTISSKLHAIESVQLTQATRPMRRLYVENLPPSASQKDLIECINKSLMSFGVNYIQGSQPCISCIVHKEKNQALLEFLTPEDASSALSLDGMPFAGSSLKLRRPKDFASVITGLSDKSVAAVDSISDIVEDSPHKIFIGGISKIIPSNMFLEIARAFGPLKAFHYEFASDLNEPCAFLEYVDHSVTAKACAGLNGMKMGGQVVTAVFATPEAVSENVGELPFYGIPEHAKPLLEEPTCVLKLMNLLDPGGLLSMSETELEDILEDIRLECSRFGAVKSINVSKPTDYVSIIKACVVKNTSEFTDAHGIDFANRSFSTEPLSESINPVGELNTSKPTETQNGLDNISQSLEDDNDSVDMCKPPSSDENMSIKTEETTNEQNAFVTEPESNDNSGNKLSIQGDLQFEECNTKIGISGEEMKLEETNALEEGCDEKDIISMNLENADMENKPLVEGNSLSEENDAKIESSGEESKIEENILPDEGGKKDTIISADIENVFEVGSIFVEYRRREAACVAAHCLHGRIFDGRVVTVGYVDRDHYHVRFRK